MNLTLRDIVGYNKKQSVLNNSIKLLQTLSYNKPCITKNIKNAVMIFR